MVIFHRIHGAARCCHVVTILNSHFLAVSSLLDSAGHQLVHFFRIHHVKELCPPLKRPLRRCSSLIVVGILLMMARRRCTAFDTWPSVPFGASYQQVAKVIGRT